MLLQDVHLARTFGAKALLTDLPPETRGLTSSPTGTADLDQVQSTETKILPLRGFGSNLFPR